MEHYEQKLNYLIEYSALAFQSKNNIHINARQSAEALCKLMILKYYGEERGMSIIYSQDDEWNSRLKIYKSKKVNSYPMVLNMLIQVCTSKSILRSCYKNDYVDKELSNVIRSTITYLESNLYALNSRGNSSAHESHRKPLYAQTTQNLLREILEWLFQDFLKIDIPNELTCYIGTYDIFISYSQKDETWVEALKQNLLLHGYKLFMDNYELIAGENKKKSLRNAIERSRNAIVIYPEENDSIWIQNELEWIRDKKEQDSNFKNIPLVIHKSKNLPHESIKYIDFSSQDYGHDFNQLLCSLERVPPSQSHIKHELILPHTPNKFVNDVLQDLESEKVLILFSQEFSDIKKYYTPIKKELRRRFSKYFYTLSIPSYKKEKKYFHSLAQSCGIEENVESLQDWKVAMQNKLSTGEEILLLITDLDNGKEECNQQLASTLRSLAYQFNDNLYIVLIGHKSLAKLVFQEHNLSPLRSVGKYLFFPYENTKISYESLLLIMSNPIIDENSELICKLLDTNQVERFSPWSYSPVINYLFWKGILIQKDAYLVWRNEEIKKIISEIAQYSKT